MVNENISNELKIYELSLIWKEAEYNFAFWEKLNGTVNWDEEYKKALPRVLVTDNLYDYYMELMRFISLLRDGHTGVWFPQIVKNNFAYLPIQFVYINGQHIITNTDKSIDIKQYSVISKIAGVDIEEYIEKNIFPYIWHEKYDSCYWQIQQFIKLGEENSEIEFEIDGQNIKIKRSKVNPEWAYTFSIKFDEKLEELYKSDSHTISKTKDDIAIITIPTFNNEKLIEEFYTNQKILESMRGFIIDVRHNGGGMGDYARSIVKAFIDGDFAGESDATQVHIAMYKAQAKWCNFGDKTYDEITAERGENEHLEKVYKINKHMYYERSDSIENHNGCTFVLNQPIVVLSSCNTASAAEDFLIYLDYAKRTTIVGSASYGLTGQPLFIDLESGGGFRICTRQCTYPDGRTFIDTGVQPHIKCENTLDDYKNGVDSVMNRGLEEIRKLI